MEAVSWSGCCRCPTPWGEVGERGRGFGDCRWRSWDGLRFAKRYAAEGGSGGEVAVIVDVSAVIAHIRICSGGGREAIDEETVRVMSGRVRGAGNIFHNSMWDLGA